MSNDESFRMRLIRIRDRALDDAEKAPGGSSLLVRSLSAVQHAQNILRRVGPESEPTWDGEGPDSEPPKEAA